MPTIARAAGIADVAPGWLKELYQMDQMVCQRLVSGVGSDMRLGGFCKQYLQHYKTYTWCNSVIVAFNKCIDAGHDDLVPDMSS